MNRRFRPNVRGLGDAGVIPAGPPPPNVTLTNTAPPPPGFSQMSLEDRLAWYGTQGWNPQSGIQEQQGNPYGDLPEVDVDARTPLSPGIDTVGFTNPYKTLMYSVTGLSTSVPVRAIPGNFKRTYLIVQNLGPGNLFVGIGTDPNAGGANVLNLVSSQVYEQIGGGFFLPPNPWYPQGLSISSSFVSPEYISLLSDTSGTAAMILEGIFSPPRAGSHAGVA